jgi:hypothetical protein
MYSKAQCGIFFRLRFQGTNGTRRGVNLSKTILLCNLKDHVCTQGYLEGGIILFGLFFYIILLGNILTCPIFRDPLCSLNNSEEIYLKAYVGYNYFVAKMYTNNSS